MIELLADFVVLLVALSHLGVLVLEMFLWQTPLGRKIFRLTPEQAAATRVLAANQGLYNGFLAAGLLWSLVPSSYATDIRIFFLACVVIAGVYGSFSVNRRILFIQALPAAIGLVLVILA